MYYDSVCSFKVGRDGISEIMCTCILSYSRLRILTTGQGKDQTDLTSWTVWIHQQSSVKRCVCSVSNCTLGLAGAVAGAVSTPDAGFDQWPAWLCAWSHEGAVRFVQIPPPTPPPNQPIHRAFLKSENIQLISLVLSVIYYIQTVISDALSWCPTH